MGDHDHDDDDFLRTGGALRSSLWKDFENGLRRLTPGTRIGDYELVNEMGRGGMGSVFRAHRADGAFTQEVAIKVLNLGTGDDALRRFELERQILASLSHPNIATLIDGGFAEGDLPYLVMELIEGETLVDFCDRRGLDLKQRLRLFIKVVRAVEYAHGRLVVHRDIKPQNILVDAEGNPKLLDFGIAKILESSDIGVDTGETGTGIRVLTLDYAAPEQILCEPISIATDVYQLGLLLYLLLTGKHPLPLAGMGLRDAEKVVCELSPLPPSIMVERLDGEESERIAGQRATRPRALSRNLAGDLDTILLKCLRKEPDRRYPSAAQLAADLINYLDDRPISARRDSVGYRIGRFIRRHRAATTSVAISVLALIAISAVYLQDLRNERDRAEEQAETAREVTRFLTGLFEAANPYESGHFEPDINLILERAYLDLHAGLNERPAVHQALLETLGSVYHDTGRLDRARNILREAQAEARSLDDPERVVSSSLTLASVLLTRNELEPAEEALAVAGREFLDPRCCSDPALAPRAQLLQARLARQRENFEQAEGLYQEALTAFREQVGSSAPETLDALYSYGILLQEATRYDEAEQVLLEVVQGMERVWGPDHVRLSGPLDTLANAQKRQDRHEAAEINLLRSLAIRQAHLPENHQGLGNSYTNLSALYLGTGDYPKALDYSEQALTVRTAVYGEASQQVAATRINIGMALTHMGRLIEAETALQQALDSLIALPEPPRSWVAITANNLADVSLKLGKLDRALELLDIAYRTYVEVHGPESARAGMARSNMGLLLVEAGRPEEALEHLRFALDIYRRERGERHRTVAYPLIGIGRAEAMLGNAETSDAAFAEALDIRVEAYGEEHEQVGDLLGEQARAALELDRPDRAAELAARSRQLVSAAHGADHPIAVQAALTEVLALAAQGQCEAGRRLFEETDALFEAAPDQLDALSGTRDLARTALADCS